MGKDILTKHKHIFIFYEYYLKNVAKKPFHIFDRYQQIGRPFYINKFSIYKIIAKMLRRHYKPTEYDIDEFKENVRFMYNTVFQETNNDKDN